MVSLELVRIGQSLRSGGTQPHPGGAVRTPVVTENAYWSAAGAAVDRCRHVHVERTASAYARAGMQFEAYLAACPPRYRRNVTSAVPLDIVTYMEGDYVPNHGRTVLPTGEVVPAFSTVKGCLAALKRLFDLHGRTGPWSDETLQGNPRTSPLVTDWLGGYERDMLKWGFEACAAYPLSDEKRRALIDYIDGMRAALAATDTKAAALFQRDALLYCYLWDSVQRGAEGARLLFGDIHEDTPLGSFSRPTLLKNRKRLRCGSCKLSRENSIYAFLNRLEAWRATLRVHGAGTSGPSPVFPAVGRGSLLEILDTPISGSVVYERFVSQLKAAGLYCGESVHSFRRGSTQARKAAGATERELMDGLLVDTPAIAQRYGDSTCLTRERAAP
jgi:hypothetical protein